MKRICGFARTPSDNAIELRACIDAGIDQFVVRSDQTEEVRQIAPHHFAGVGSTSAQFGSTQDIMDHAFAMMSKGGDMHYTLHSFDVMEMLATSGVSSIDRRLSRRVWPCYDDIFDTDCDA